jgi:hypothetical protein
VFAFARKLKGLFPRGDAVLLRPLVRRWHEAALPFIGAVPFEDTWGMFLEAWTRIRHAGGEGPFERLWKKSGAAPGPRVARNYDDPRLRRLVTFLSLLHRHFKGAAFYLDCRRAALLLGVHRNTANRWLSVVLVADGVLELVTRGSKAKGLANEWRFIASMKSGG